MLRSKTPQSNKICLDPRQISNLFLLSSQLADFSEDLMESQGLYSDDFKNDLEKSVQQFAEGKTIKINSILDLI